MSTLDTLTVRITGDASALKSSLSSASSSVSGFANDVTSTTSKSTSSSFDNLGNKILGTTGNVITNWGNKLVSGVSNTLKSAGNAVSNVAGMAVGMAANKVMGSVSDAISRSDIMNNFSLVMSNMQISTEDSEAAISELSDRLTGLPTSLDTAASGVERLTAKNKDVSYSTDLWLALNDALLAGGQSSEIQANAMEQLMQAYSKGSFDLTEWQTLQIAMPAQLDQVSQAFGMTADDLYEALKSGEVSMDQFMDKMIEMDTTSTETFTSFNEQAFNATGGIQTSLDLIDTAITRGIANIIDALDRAEITAFLGHISDSIDDLAGKVVDFLNECADTGALDAFWEVLTKLWDIIGKVGEVIGAFVQKLLGIEDPADTAKGVLDAVSDALDWLSGVLDWVIENMDWLVPVIEGVVAALIGFDILNTVGGWLKETKESFEIFGSVLDVISENKIVIIIGVIIALIGWIIDLWNNNEDFRNAVLTIWDAICGFFEAAGEVIGAVIGAIVGFFTEDIPAAWDKAVACAQQLWDNICYIFQCIGDFIGGIVDGIVGFFTETIPNAWNDYCERQQALLDAVMEVFGAIGEFISGVVDAIIGFFTETIPNAASDMWETVCNVFWEAVDFVAGIFDTIITTISDAFWGIIDFIAGIGWDIWNAVSGAFQDAIDFILGLPEQALQWGADIIQGIIDGIWSMISGIGDAVGNIASTIASFLGFSVPEVGPLSDFDTYMPDMMELMQQGIEEGAPMVEEAANDAANSIATSMSEAFNFMAEDTNNAFNGVVDIVTENLSNLNTEALDIVSNTTSGITSDFVDMDSTIEKDVEEMVGNVEEQLKTLSDYLDDSSIDISDWSSDLTANFNKAYTDIMETTTSSFDDMNTYSTQAMASMSEGVNAGLDDLKTNATRTLDGLATTSDNTFKSMTDNAIASVSRMNDGINTQLATAETSMADFESYASEWGENLGNEIAEGIVSSKAAIREAVYEIAQEVDAALGFSEPDTGPLSDFDESMPDMVDLMVEGLLENRDEVQAAAEVIGDALLSGITGDEDTLVAQLGDLFNDLIDNAGVWGLNFAEAFADGIREGTIDVLDAIEAMIANPEYGLNLDTLGNLAQAASFITPAEGVEGGTTNNYYVTVGDIQITDQNDSETFLALLSRYKDLALS